MCGSETFAMEVSNTSINVASVTETAISQGLVSRRVPESLPRIRRRAGRRDDRAGHRPAAAGPLDHPQPRQDTGHRRERARDECCLAEPRRTRGVLRTTRKRAPGSIADLPSSTPQADEFAKQLKSHGYRFVGPTSVYAFMQNVGVVNDHIHGCFQPRTTPNHKPASVVVGSSSRVSAPKGARPVPSIHRRLRGRQRQVSR